MCQFSQLHVSLLVAQAVGADKDIVFYWIYFRFMRCKSGIGITVVGVVEQNPFGFTEHGISICKPLYYRGQVLYCWFAKQLCYVKKVQYFVAQACHSDILPRMRTIDNRIDTFFDGNVKNPMWIRHASPVIGWYNTFLCRDFYRILGEMEMYSVLSTWFSKQKLRGKFSSAAPQENAWEHEG